ADRSAAMVAALWPKDTDIPARVLTADWEALDLPDASFDIAFCDGGFAFFDMPEGQRRLAGVLARLLRRDGAAVIRCYLQPERPEPVEAVFDDLLAGRIGGFHVFRWRLVMALQPDSRSGVRLGDVYEAARAALAARPALADALAAWPEPVVRTLDAYRG